MHISHTHYISLSFPPTLPLLYYRHFLTFSKSNKSGADRYHEYDDMLILIELFCDLLKMHLFTAYHDVDIHTFGTTYIVFVEYFTHPYCRDMVKGRKRQSVSFELWTVKGWKNEDTPKCHILIFCISFCIWLFYTMKSIILIQ